MRPGQSDDWDLTGAVVAEREVGFLGSSAGGMSR